MKKYLLIIGLASVFFSGVCSAQTPHSIAGFVLNKNIEHYKDVLKQQTELPIRYMEYLREVEIKKIDGYKSGLILYGTCTDPGRIVKIKLKYADSTKKFYERLLKKFKNRFGEPTEWRGDPFHIVIDWKWSFKDQDDNRISLHLQHNTKDAEEKIGNAVKLTMTNAIEEEGRCFEKKHPEHRASAKEGKSRKKVKTNDWDQFVPR